MGCSPVCLLMACLSCKNQLNLRFLLFEDEAVSACVFQCKFFYYFVRWRRLKNILNVILQKTSATAQRAARGDVLLVTGFKQEQEVLSWQETCPQPALGVRWCAAQPQVATDSLQIPKQLNASELKHIRVARSQAEQNTYR